MATAEHLKAHFQDNMSNLEGENVPTRAVGEKAENMSTEDSKLMSFDIFSGSLGAHHVQIPLKKSLIQLLTFYILY